ncbi:MAG TPA: hypothetical protein VJI13_05775 [Candidatus Norongarragalinales archaeon]|nr:hypothetical protein [Candidatus Norongarragalinales archaeon]
MMKMAFLVLASVLLFGCTTQNPPQSTPSPTIDAKYLNDPLYCENDEDCTRQQTSCCYGPVNIYNVKPFTPEEGDGSFCKMVCRYTVPKCVENICILERE